MPNPDIPEHNWIRMSKSQALDLIERLLKDILEVSFRVEGNLDILIHPISLGTEQTSEGEKPEQTGVYIQFTSGGAIVSKQEIWRVIWPDRPELDNASLEKLVSRLRVKIEPDPNNPQHLRTIRGRGYRLAVE